MKRITRRSFLWTAFGAALAGGAYSQGGAAPHTHAHELVETGAAGANPAILNSADDVIAAGATAGTLPIPPLLGASRGAFELTMSPGEAELIPGQLTPTLGFNGDYLGPTIRVARGQPVQFAISNQLGEPTTVHWHGMHLPAGMDGGPHQIIQPGSVWRPGWTVRQQAATLWYHPHLMGATQRQVSRGLAGMLIVDDATPIQQSLPHLYGVDDLPIILQEAAIGPDGQLILRGGGRAPRGATLVNGAIAPWFDTPAARVRLGILNASAGTFYTFGLADGGAFEQIASDGGLLPAPVALSGLQLGPAERAEMVLGLTPGTPVHLQARTNNRGGQVRDLVTLSTSGDDADAEPLRTQGLGIFNRIERMDPKGPDFVRDMVLARAGRGFAINGSSMRTDDDMMHMDGVMRVQLGDTELWRVINNSGVTHLFHVHDVQFQIMDRNGAQPPAQEMGWKDTVMVRPNETVRIMMGFADYADVDRPYMFHCHILGHEDGGMMGQFVVVPRATTAGSSNHDGMEM